MSRETFSRIVGGFIVFLIVLCCALLMYVSVYGSDKEYKVYLPLILTPPPVSGLASAYEPLKPGEAEMLNIEWYYNYGIRPSAIGNRAEFVPYFWCDIYPALKYPPVVDYFDQMERWLPDDYSGKLLFLNEPDLEGSNVDGGQCDRTPRQAAYIYKGILDVCPNCYLVGPSLSHRDYLNGWPWLREFYDIITDMGLRYPDESAIHTYLEREPITLIIDSHFDLLSEYQWAPTTAWITEMGFCNTYFARSALKAVQMDRRITRYAWFTARGYPFECLNLMDDGLTPAGKAWVESTQ